MKVREFAKGLQEYLVTIDDFNIIKTIGRGGFGEVYMAEHKASGIICALKKLTISEEEFQGQHEKYFIREVDILSKTNNPFLLHLLGFSDHYPYVIATEFITRGSLFDAIHRKPNAPVLDGTQLTIIALIIATCFQNLHEVNIIHRDIKALNVLLDDNLLPHICDFGISRELKEDLQNSEQAGPVTGEIGTPNWMAPELFSTDGYTNKVDVYAYGILLWEMLTGEVPFSGKQPFIIMQEIMRGERPKIPDDTPTGLRKLITSCWAQNPDDRPTFAQIVKVLKNHKASFADCDDARVEEIFNSVKNMKTVSLQNAEHTNQQQPQNFSRIINDPTDPNFDAACVNAINNMKSENFLQFLQIIIPNTPNTKPSSIIKILDAMATLLKHDQKCAEIFIASNTFNLLPYNIAECIPACNNLIESIFYGQPKAITQNSIDFVITLCQSSPVTSINSLANYIYNITEPLVESAVRYLFTYADYFKNAENADLVIDTLFYYASKNPTYQYLPNIIQVFQSFLTSSNENAINASYRAIIELHVTDAAISSEILAAHLRFPSLVLSVLLYLSSAPQKLQVTPALVMAILQYAKSDQLAVFVLCLFAERDDTAAGLIQTYDKWISSPFLTIADSTRIFLACMCNVNLRPLIARIPELGSFFKVIVDSGDKELIDTLVIVIRRLDQFIQNDFMLGISKSKFLGALLRRGLAMQSADMVSSGLTIAEQLSRKNYIIDYLEYVQYATNFIKTSQSIELKQICISFLYTLSRYAEPRPYLVQSNLKDALNPNYISPELMSYANATFTNLGI
jgi:serine/threonine protein kinase